MKKSINKCFTLTSIIPYLHIVVTAIIISALNSCEKNPEPEPNAKLDYSVFEGRWEDSELGYIQFELQLVNDTLSLTNEIDNGTIETISSSFKDGKLTYAGRKIYHMLFAAVFNYELTFIHEDTIKVEGELVIEGKDENYTANKTLIRSEGPCEHFNSEYLVGTWQTRSTVRNRFPWFEFIKDLDQVDGYMHSWSLYLVPEIEIVAKNYVVEYPTIFPKYGFLFDKEYSSHTEDYLEMKYDVSLMPLCYDIAVGEIKDYFLVNGKITEEKYYSTMYQRQYKK